MIASPTGSGKTLVAEVALLREALENGRTGVYLAPMRAIASEKRDDWRRLEEAGLMVYKTTGEDDAFDPAQAQAADIIVSTPEKWDSVSRRALPGALVERIGTIVCDEVHLVDDEHRGPGLEALLARLHLAFPAARLIAMSGTLLNVEAIARWLRADVVRSTWRPVRLHTAVVPYPEAGNWRDDETGRNALAAEIAATTLREEGAVVVFCGSRMGVEGCAEALSEALGQKVTGPAAAENAALRRCLARGVGFHHAGLARGDRAAVETAFRAGTIKVLVATSTVAAGVNLPARVVVVRDLSLGVDELRGQRAATDGRPRRPSRPGERGALLRVGAGGGGGPRCPDVGGPSLRLAPRRRHRHPPEHGDCPGHRARARRRAGLVRAHLPRPRRPQTGGPGGGAERPAAGRLRAGGAG